MILSQFHPPVILKTCFPSIHLMLSFYLLSLPSDLSCDLWYNIWVTSVGFWQWCISINQIVFMGFIHRLLSQDQKRKNYRPKKTKNLNRSNNKASTFISQKDQITNHTATNLDTHIHKHLKPENTGGKKWHTHTQITNAKGPKYQHRTINLEKHTHTHTHEPRTYKRQ
jgi:hypothetical protein